MRRCDYCGSAFGDRVCYFCESACCTSCMTDDRSRCRACHAGKRRLGWKRLLARNKFLLVFAAALWLYAVFPGPFIPGQSQGFYTATVIAAVLITAPILLIMFFWSMTPPTSDARRRG